MTENGFVTWDARQSLGPPTSFPTGHQRVNEIANTRRGLTDGIVLSLSMVNVASRSRDC